jgi:hypothetical protein
MLNIYVCLLSSLVEETIQLWSYFRRDEALHYYSHTFTTLH